MLLLHSIAGIENTTNIRDDVEWNGSCKKEHAVQSIAPPGQPIKEMFSITDQRRTCSNRFEIWYFYFNKPPFTTANISKRVVTWLENVCDNFTGRGRKSTSIEIECTSYNASEWGVWTPPVYYALVLKYCSSWLLIDSDDTFPIPLQHHHMFSQCAPIEFLQTNWRRCHFQFMHLAYHACIFVV